VNNPTFTIDNTTRLSDLVAFLQQAQQTVGNVSLGNDANKPCLLTLRAAGRGQRRLIIQDASDVNKDEV
jgi:hypothetical protein